MGIRPDDLAIDVPRAQLDDVDRAVFDLVVLEARRLQSADDSLLNALTPTGKRSLELLKQWLERSLCAPANRLHVYTIDDVNAAVLKERERIEQRFLELLRKLHADMDAAALALRGTL